MRNRVEKRISLPKADWISPSADALWVSSETGKIYKVDPASMAVLATVTVGANPLATTWVAGNLWVPNIDDNTRLGGRSRRRARVVSTQSGPARARSRSPRPRASPGSRRTSTGDLWRFDP